MALASITVWNRVEPRRRTDDVSAGLRAEVRDPLWMLTRQWQMGELRGEDAGSPAYTRVVTKTAPVADWTPAGGADGSARSFDGKQPLEAVGLSEPHTPDVATQVELGQTFFQLVERHAPAALAVVTRSFGKWAPVTPRDAAPFDPIDRASKELLDVVTDRAANGVRIWELTQQNPIVLPDVVAADLDSTTVADVVAALVDFKTWVAKTYGAFGNGDPPAWQPPHLEYRLAAGVRTAPDRRAALAVVPAADGVLDWSSFDVTDEPQNLLDAVVAPSPALVIPSRLRYPGLPWARFWRFEGSDPSYPDVSAEMPELVKLLVIDFAIKSGVDWFQVAVQQPVGTIARIESLIVHDVFGTNTVIDRADDPNPNAGLARWSMFGLAASSGGLASFTILPPGVGRAALPGPALEQVRFARDENANMSWGIEAVTESVAGEPRPGIERDAAVAATLPDDSTVTDVTSPLRYLIENRVPIQWVPLVPIDEGVNLGHLQRGAVALPTKDGVELAFAIGKILNPAGIPATEGYRIPDEEVPRAGLRIERFVSRARWIDGSSHLWVSRRRRTGAGETQSGLAFDLALPVPR